MSIVIEKLNYVYQSGSVNAFKALTESGIPEAVNPRLYSSSTVLCSQRAARSQSTALT